MFQEPTRKITKTEIEKLCKIYEKLTGVNPLEKSRRKEIITARYSLLFLLKRHYDLHPNFLAYSFGCDRTTVLHGLKTAKRLAEVNDESMVNSLLIVQDLILECKSELLDDFQGSYSQYLYEELMRKFTRVIEDRSVTVSMASDLLSRVSEQLVKNFEQ